MEIVNPAQPMIIGQVRELKGILSQIGAYDDFIPAKHRFTRWKERTTQLIEELIGPEEAKKFAGIFSSYSYGDDPLDTLRNHAKECEAFLTALFEEIGKYGETYGAAPLKVNDREKAAGESASSMEGKKQRRVFVIYGRDSRLRRGMFDFLRAIGLDPKEWPELTALTGEASPYIGQILDAGFKEVQAVVALFTPDDLARLRADLVKEDDAPEERVLSGQPRPNVLFEAGMAFASHPRQTVLVQVGKIRQISDIGGRHIVMMNSSVASRQELANRLKAAGCPVNLEGIDWHTAGDLQPPSLSPTISPQISPHSAQQSNAQAQRLQPQKANLILRRAEVVGIRTAASSCGGIFYESQNQENALGIIACFRNEPSTSRSVFDADCVRAQIVYRKDQEQEIRDGVSSACWLGHDLDMINFRLGESHCVLLGFLDGGNGLVVPWKRRQRDSDGDTISLESLTFEAVASMEVRLIGENNGLLLAPLVLDVSITNKETHIVVKPQ